MIQINLISTSALNATDVRTGYLNNYFGAVRPAVEIENCVSVNRT